MTRLASFLIIFFVILSCESTEDNSIQPYFYQNGEVLTIFENDSKGINVILLGDGFIKKDLAHGGIYETSGRSILEYLFTIPPFSTYQDYFNAYIVFAESKDSGIGNENFPGKTPFGTAYNETNDRLILNNPQECIRYARNAVGYDPEKAHIVILLANDYRRGGIASGGIAVTSHRSKEKVAVHEVGHTFANLADEYISASRAESRTNGPWSLAELVSKRPNVDLEPNYQQSKWSHFKGVSGYESVGTYEGGFYLQSGVWRPEQTSIMLSSGVPHFNAPSREAIVKRIFAIKGIPYSFEEFKKNDVIPLNNNARFENQSYDMIFNCQ